MRFALMALVALSFATPALAQNRAITQSWGKPGVSFAQYRTDGIECGRAGYYLDISTTDDAKEFVKASRKLDERSGNFSEANNPYAPVWTQLEPLIAANDSQRIVDGLRPGERMKHLRGILQERVETCLVSRGYRRFALTAEQRRRLARLPVGKPARHDYLYALASDPAVLAAQALP